MFGVHQNSSKLQLVLGDIRDIDAVETLLKIVMRIHCAAYQMIQS